MKRTATGVEDFIQQNIVTKKRRKNQMVIENFFFKAGTNVDEVDDGISDKSPGVGLC